MVRGIVNDRRIKRIYFYSVLNKITRSIYSENEQNILLFYVSLRFLDLNPEIFKINLYLIEFIMIAIYYCNSLLYNKNKAFKAFTFEEIVAIVIKYKFFDDERINKKKCIYLINNLDKNIDRYLVYYHLINENFKNTPFAKTIIFYVISSCLIPENDQKKIIKRIWLTSNNLVKSKIEVNYDLLKFLAFDIITDLDINHNYICMVPPFSSNISNTTYQTSTTPLTPYHNPATPLTPYQTPATPITPYQTPVTPLTPYQTPVTPYTPSQVSYLLDNMTPSQITNLSELKTPNQDYS